MDKVEMEEVSFILLVGKGLAKNERESTEKNRPIFITFRKSDKERIEKTNEQTNKSTV